MRGNGSAPFVELPFPPPLLFRANLLLDSFPNHRHPPRYELFFLPLPFTFLLLLSLLPLLVSRLLESNRNCSAK